MTKLIIEIPDKVEKTLNDLITLLGGKVVVTDRQKKLNKATKKQQILKNVDESIALLSFIRKERYKLNLLRSC